MMLDIMNRHKERFVSQDKSLLKKVDFSEQLISRITRLESVTES